MSRALRNEEKRLRELHWTNRTVQGAHGEMRAQVFSSNFTKKSVKIIGDYGLNYHLEKPAISADTVCRRVMKPKYIFWDNMGDSRIMYLGEYLIQEARRRKQRCTTANRYTIPNQRA